MADRVAVGAWAAARREDYWAGQLRPDQVAALESIGGWSWEGSAQRRWEMALRALQRYVDRYSQLPPPSAWLRKVRVGAWVEAQWAAHEAGTLPAVLAERLEAVPGWTWAGTGDRWEAGLEALRLYVTEHGSAQDLDRDCDYRGFRLGQWVQRYREDGRAGGLTTAQVAVLEAIPGWRWSADIDRWERGLSLLQSYAAKNGHAAPPQKVVVDGFALGMWVTNRRRAYQRGLLSPQRAAVLEALPGWSWLGWAAEQERHLAAVARYVAEQGHQPDADAVFDGVRIGRWAARQRSLCRRGGLDEEWVSRLEQLPGWQW